MDDASEVGRYGVLRLMKRKEPDSEVTSFPIDSEEVTFGRNPDCSIRLYYPTVSGMHARIFFQESKAFLEVIGAHGLQVDNCPVFPTASTSHNPKPTTIPLPNNTLITIHKKHFKFSYPPKNLRPMLLSTPSPSKHAPRKALRLSMIESAKVFTPRPSKDARENLKVLQSPLKTGQPSPLKRTTFPAESEEEEIVLVDGNKPKVIQEERDLVIVENVMLPAEPEPIPAPALKRPEFGTTSGAGGPSTPRVRQASAAYNPPARIQHSQQNQQEQFRTPQPKRQPRSSLHRAVLLRSAQRAQLKAEMEVEDARVDDDDEEREVASGLGVAVLEEDEEDENEPEEAPKHGEAERQFENEVDTEPVAEGEDRIDEDEQDEQEHARPEPVSSWRKSLGAVAEVVAWPVRAISRSRSRSPEKMAQEDGQDITDAEPEEETDQNDQQTKQPYNPTDFTPQRVRNPHPQRFMSLQGGMGRAMEPPRFSLSGADAAGARRVPVVQPWRLKDITVPMPLSPANARTNVMPSPERRGRTGVSAAERQAIQERRRSTLHTTDEIFGDRIPGSRPSVLEPPQRPTQSTMPAPSPFARRSNSPVKGNTIREEDEEEDTSVLLERMNDMVEVLKRRRSLKMEEEERRKSLAALEKAKEEGDMDEDAMDDSDGGEGEERTEESRPSSSTAAKGKAPATPRYSGVRPLFKEAEHEKRVAEMGTPKMDGVRAMYLRNEPHPSRPKPTSRESEGEALESLGEMYSTPVTYRQMQVPPAPPEEEDDEENGRGTPEPVPVATGRGTRGRKTPAAQESTKPPSRSTRRTPASSRRSPDIDTPMADDELTPEVGGAVRSGAAGKGKEGAPRGAVVRRGRRVARDDGDDDELDAEGSVEGETEVPAPAPAKAAARGRKAADTKTKPAPKSKASTSKVKPKPIEDDEEVEDSEEESQAPAPSKPLARRTRTATASTADDEPPPTRMKLPSATRKTRAISKTSITTDDETSATNRMDVPMKVGPPKRAAKATTSTSTRSRSRAGTQSEDDPLDTIDKAESSQSDSTRRKPAATARAKRGMIPQVIEEDEDENDEEEEAQPAAKARVGRPKKTGIPSAAATSRRAASSKKKDDGKENTPDIEVKEEDLSDEADAPKKAKSDPKPKMAPAPPAAKVSRMRKPTTQSEPERETVQASGSRSTRSRIGSARK